MKSLLSFATLALFVIASICLTGCAKSDKNDLKEGVANEKKLVIATCAEFAPFESIGANGSYQGIDIDIAETLAKWMNLELEIKNMAFDQIIGEVMNGSADLGIAGITISDERKEKVDFSIPYYSAGQVIVIPNGSDITCVEDLRGKRLGVQSGTTGETYVKENIQDATVKSAPRASDVILMLIQTPREIDAAILDNEPARNFQAKNNHKIQLLDTPLTTEEYGVMVRKGNDELLMKVNKYLGKMKEDGEIEKFVLNNAE